MNGEEKENKGTEGPTEEDAKGKEAKDYALFEKLCDTVVSSLVLLQGGITELMDFKDQLMNHPLPSNLLTRLVVTTGKIFRSASDMFTPTSELVRLVRFYATSWEQKKEILQRIYVNHERKKHQLSVAVRKLQLLDTQTKWFARERQILNWEKLFVKLTTTKAHGRRWKFRVEHLKRKGTLSSESQRFIGTPTRSKKRDGQTDPKQHVVSKETESSKNLAVREDQEVDTDGSNEDKDEENEDSDSEQVPAVRKNTIDGEAQTEGQTEEQGTWTGDPLHCRFLSVTATKFYGCFEQGLSCFLTYHQERQQIQLVQAKARQKNKALKQVKINESKQDLPLTGSDSGILKAPEVPKNDFAKSAVESMLTGTQGANFEMTKDSDVVEMLLFHDQKGVIAEGEFKLSEDLLMEQKHVSDKEIQLFTPGSTRLPARIVAALCISLKVEEVEESLSKDQSTEAWSLQELVLDVTGIDLKETRQNELEKCLRKPELRESCTSAMSWASSSSVAKPGLVSEEQVQLLIEEHNFQLSQLQEQHQNQLRSLLESFRTSVPDCALDQTLLTDMPERMPRSESAYLTAENKNCDAEANGEWTQNHSARDVRSVQTGPKPPPKSAAARQKISVSKSLLLKKKLPEDVWERMKILEENMWRNKHSTIEKLQSETSRKLEKQLSVQKRLQLHSDDVALDSRSKDEICLPALFMPMKTRQVFMPKARLYFHPSGSAGFFRLTQAPSIFSLPPLGCSTRMSVLNLLNPSVTLPMTSAVHDNNTPEEAETVVNRMTPEPYPMNPSWAGSMSIPEEKY